ncbi:Ribbon-helix-helix protein, copG family [compost metagenome]
MVTTVRLDEKREDKLSQIAEMLDKKKSDVLREALDYYAEYILEQKKTKFKLAVDKVKEADFKEYKTYEGTVDDGL